MEESENESASESNEELNQTPALNFMQTPAFDGLTEPVSVYLGFLPDSLQLPDDFGKDVKDDVYKFMEENKIQVDHLMDALVENFNKHHIKAARYDKPYNDIANNDQYDAQDPNVLMVTRTGIQSPFISPEDAKTAAMIYGTIINETPGLKTYGYANSMTLEQLPDPLTNPRMIKVPGKAPVPEKKRFTEQISVHPNPAKAEQILKDRGWDDMTPKQLTSLVLEEAEKLPLYTLQPDQNKTGAQSFPPIGTYIYSGSPFPQPKTVISDTENKSNKFGTLYAGIASNYPTLATGRKDISFMHGYRMNSLNLFFTNATFERGAPPTTNPNKKYETSICPHLNEYVDTFIVIDKPDKSREFRLIPKDNDLWKDIMELYRPSLPSKSFDQQQRCYYQKQLGADGGLYICDAMGNPTNRNKILHKVNGKYQIDYIASDSPNQTKEAVEKNTQPQEKSKEDTLNKIAILSGRSPESLKNALSANKQHQQQKAAETSQTDQKLNNKNSNKDAENIKILRGLTQSNSQNKPNNDNNRQMTQTSTLTNDELLQEQLKQRLKDGGR